MTSFMPPRLRAPGGTFRRIILPAAVLLVPALITYAFLELGSFFAREDPLEKADAILVLAGSQMTRPLEAADLYLEGYSPLVILTGDPPEGGQTALKERGIVFAGDIQRVVDVFQQLGIPREAILVPERIHTNTASEAVTLRELAQAHGWRRVIVVTSTYHLRRARFAFRREVSGTDVDVRMRGTRYDEMDPAHWWKHRRDIREIVEETPRLAAYVLGLGA